MLKKILEVLVCILHPLAVILAWINLAGRTDMTPVLKVVWAILMIIPIVPVIYVLVSGDLW